MVESKKIIDSEYITGYFGLRSQFFVRVMKFLEKKAISQKENYDKKFKQWFTIFKSIYGEINSLNSEFFLKHTYFGLILKSLLIIKLCINQNLDIDDAYDDYISNNLETLLLPEFNRVFYWVDLNKKIFEKIYKILEFSNFALQDLFIDVYQQIFFSVTRHKIGEFYTPSKLVKKMVDDSYDFNRGLKVLDPSCGSGNFLVEIIVNILNSKSPDDIKLEKINKIYGFDINPLATLTTKINLILIFLNYFDIGENIFPSINIYLIDSLFPEQNENNIDLRKLYSSFDLIIGNPPWLTYKDVNNKNYQIKIRNLAGELGIKPLSQYITHIELATLFFYSCTKFLKKGGKIFFVITKSVLNGDHCYKFRSFSLFNKNLEIWDFPKNHIFNISHICLKAEYIGKNDILIGEKYPIKAKIFNDDLDLIEETYYSSFKIEDEGAKIILPVDNLKVLNSVSYSQYKDKFFQGATLVPRTLVFFQIDKRENSNLSISTDPDIISRAKKNWRFSFQSKEIEENFRFKTFLNKYLIPFYLKSFKNVFLPITNDFQFNNDYLKQFPKAMKFYNEMNEIYKKNKKSTSSIYTLFSNLNYWNKLTKQYTNKSYLIIYNASGSNLKAAVIENLKKNIIVGSENYYYSTDSKEEAYYLSGILNAPIFTKNIKMIMSSRHIHKRPFSFPIPLYDKNNELHYTLAKIALKCESIVHDLFIKNPKINSEKIKIIVNQKLQILNDITKKIVFNVKI